jgi:hypothetical protein
VASWKITATTIFCDAVDDEVTVLIYSDFSNKCTGYQKYLKPTKEVNNLLKKRGKRLGRDLACRGLDCPSITQYKEKLLAEEADKGSKAAE